MRFSEKKVRLFDDLLIVFSTLITGSKGVFLWLNSFYSYALGIEGFKKHLNQFKLSKYSRLFGVILVPFLVLYLIALFGGGGELGLINKILNYKNSTGFAVRAISEWEEKRFQYKWANILDFFLVLYP